MSKVFISFLGTGKYCECNYALKGKTVHGVRYIQEALLDLLSCDFTQSDRALIFTTKEAEAKNWTEKLEKRLSPFGKRFSVENVSVPDGGSEKEIWEIFTIVFNTLKEGDDVILDITHGFRSLPMLSIVLLNYARFLKRINVRGIYYGAFEALGNRSEVEKIPLSERNAPVFDLTSFDVIQQWGFASENFVNYGNAEKVSELLEKSIPEGKH
ncbi:MAG: TIGR02221 family CRISPR-associated protein, partial [Nitrospinota bacterium]